MPRRAISAYDVAEGSKSCLNITERIGEHSVPVCKNSVGNRTVRLTSVNCRGDACRRPPLPGGKKCDARSSRYNFDRRGFSDTFPPWRQNRSNLLTGCGRCRCGVQRSCGRATRLCFGEPSGVDLELVHGRGQDRDAFSGRAAKSCQLTLDVKRRHRRAQKATSSSTDRRNRSGQQAFVEGPEAGKRCHRRKKSSRGEAPELFAWRREATQPARFS